MRRRTQENSFARQVKSRLALDAINMAVLAASLGVHRVSISRAINHPPQNPDVARKVRAWLTAK